MTHNDALLVLIAELRMQIEQRDEEVAELKRALAVTAQSDARHHE